MTTTSISTMINNALSVKNSIANTLENYGETTSGLPFSAYPALIEHAIVTSGGAKLLVSITSPSGATGENLPVTLSWSVGNYTSGDNVVSIVIIDNQQAIYCGNSLSVEINNFEKEGNYHEFYVVAISGTKLGASSVRTFIVNEPEEEPSVEP